MKATTTASARRLVRPRRSLARLAECTLFAALALLLARLPARGAEPRPAPIPVVDLHVDLPYQFGYQGQPFAAGSGQFPAAKLLRAGVVGVVLPLFVPAKVSPSGPRLEDLESSYRRVVDALKLTPPFAPPGCVESPGQVRTFLAFEGAAPLAAAPEALDQWVARGVRSIGLVHTRQNALASSSGDPLPLAQGLSAEGRALVRRAQQLGVPVDVSHASDRATREVLTLARTAQVPVIATHSNARALTPHPRNLSDALIRGIASSGGVIGVNFHARFLTGTRHARLDDVVRHIRYLVRVAGVDHVALGSDFEGDITAPAGLESVTALPDLAARLAEVGLSRGAIEQIFSRNALRVLCGAAEAP